MNNPTPLPSGCIVFDLDGTLIDSIGDIAEAVNRLRESRSATLHSTDTVRAAVGDGARVLCQRILSDILEDGESVEHQYQQFMSIYCQIAEDSSRDIRWLPGTVELLDHLRLRQTPVAILTNKPRRVTETLRPRLDLHGPWADVVSPEDVGIPKPDPSGLLGILERLRCAPRDAAMVGDSAVDFSTGIAAGVRTIGRRGGYGTASPPEPDLWVDQLDQLIAD